MIRSLKKEKKTSKAKKFLNGVLKHRELFLLSMIVCSFVFSSYEAQSKSSQDVILKADFFIKLAEKINPTVVNIYTSQNNQLSSSFPKGDPFYDFFKNFLGPHFRALPTRALGTGFLIREDGLILTNNHVVDKADVIKVQLSEKDKNIDARMIGKDARTDIALIKVSVKKKLSVAQLGTSQNVKPGQWVAAFGNPFGHGHTMTKGIVSAIDRRIDELNHVPFIQTDAAINQGNSGGPLVDLDGKVIGVNTAIDARAHGIGFAIPIDKVKALIPRLEKEGVIKRGFLGVNLENVNEKSSKALNLRQTQGALVTYVIPKTPAHKAGVLPYDFVIQFDSHKIREASDLVNAVSSTKVGAKVRMKVIRNAREKTLTVKVGEHPEDKILVRPSSPLSVEKSTKAPHNLGFKISNSSKELQKRFQLPEDIKKLHPIVVEVLPGSSASKAGLLPGDMILDVNRREVFKVKDVLNRLKKKSTNALRIMRKNSVFLVYLTAEK